MSTTLKLTHKAIGVEVRRGTFDVVVDGERVGSLEILRSLAGPRSPHLRGAQGHHLSRARPSNSGMSRASVYPVGLSRPAMLGPTRGDDGEPTMTTTGRQDDDVATRGVRLAGRSRSDKQPQAGS
jgi:hypothetical protein